MNIHDIVDSFAGRVSDAELADFRVKLYERVVTDLQASGISYVPRNLVWTLIETEHRGRARFVTYEVSYGMWELRLTIMEDVAVDGAAPTYLHVYPS